MTTDHAEATGDADWEREPDPSDSLRTFGAVVQALREHAGLSRVEFGGLVRFSKHTVESPEATEGLCVRRLLLQGELQDLKAPDADPGRTGGVGACLASVGGRARIGLV